MAFVRIKHRLFKHYKGGIYQVLMYCRCSETTSPMVVYQSLITDEIWVRNFDVFYGHLSDGRRRFAEYEHPDEICKTGMTETELFEEVLDEKQIKENI